MFDGLRRLLSRVGKAGTIAVGLVLWEVGARIGLPGLSGDILADLFRKSPGGLLGLYNLLSGGGLSRGAVLALGIAPYLSALAMMRLARFASPQLEAVWADHAGRARLHEWTRRLTLLLAAIQGIGFARFAQNAGAAPLGGAFIAQTMLILAAGSVFTMLVSEQLSGRNDESPAENDEGEVEPTAAPQQLSAGPAEFVMRSDREAATQNRERE
jgi:preprotein translocase subunit SecY